MPLSYQGPGLRLSRGAQASRAIVKDLQRDLRRLGYIATGIDGIFGRATEEAIKALQFDLLYSRGEGSDGSAPVRVRDYNKARIASVDGILEEKLAGAMADMLADGRFPKVPESPDPAAENARVAGQLAAMKSAEVPVPFLIGILKQESGLRHFSVPAPANDDNFVVVGLDRKADGSPAIASRGYGIGQYTLFHHPPTHDEVSRCILDARASVERAAADLRDKFLRFVNGSTPGTRADDRQAEFGRGALRRCKYEDSDPRYMSACRDCLAAAGATRIQAGLTRFYAGASRVYEPTQNHPETEYNGVPVRANIGCDWPYAVRRYNGGGLDSYHYQAKVLLRVLNG
jgi:peptidoglycan hydrolase-like protein with peptidoglycan-binding domain